ncbi:MAG TPA: BTAD domain-containing putative transcriptional regulator [Gaiellaceae bacterium]|nr:BTAD domain-containing putative transcriptional regulator [Gaiellaceae bacterium]
MLEFSILGPLEVRAAGAPLSLGGPKPRELLALLLLHLNQPVSTDRLIDELWGDRPPETAANTLQAHVSHLRRVLHAPLTAAEEPALITQAPGYLLRARPESLDADRFEQLVRAADAARAAGAADQAVGLLTEALELWRGPVLADVGELRAAQPEIARLEELRRRALEDRIACELDLGRHLEVLPEIEALVAQNPLAERLRTQLMLALYRSGRQAEALEAYRAARDALKAELGLEPGPELRRVHLAILRHDRSLLAPDPDGLPPESRLPSFLTAFVGREGEVDEVAELMRAGARLVTLTGLGGMGKTRLGIEVARTLESHGMSVSFVQLASINEPALVGSTIAQALGESGVAAEDSLVQHLRAQGPLLIVLDNFEQVLEAAPLLVRLLAAPQLSLLVTSRAPLRLSGEHEYPLPPLPLDDAVALFADRARAVNPQFALAEGDAEAVRELCVRLDGLPLAIELAAARSKLLTPTALLGRLTSRLDVLAEGPRDAPARHRGLRTTLDWSYELLTPSQQRVFARLAVFRGGCTLEAAEVVCGAGQSLVLDDVAGIVDESLANHHWAPQPRVTMLETVREYALERLRALGEEEDVRLRHASYFLELAEQGEGESVGPDQVDWFERLGQEHDNFRAALSWFRDRGDHEAELRLCVALWRLWQTRGYLDEGRRALESVLAAKPDADPLLRARSLNGAGVLAGEQGDFEAAGRFFEASLKLARELGEHARIASALANLGNLALFAGDFEQARRLYEESIQEAVLGEVPATERIARENLGLVALDEGDLDRAIALLEESRTLAERDHDERTRASSTRVLAAALLENGDHDRARELLEESLALARRLGEVNGLAYCLDTMAGLAAAEGQPEQAAVFFGAADIARSSIGALRPPDEQPLYERWLARTLSELDAAVYAARYEDGRLLDLDQACELALETLAVGRRVER